MSEKVYPQGITCFAKSEKAPDFVVGAMIIDLAKFREWINGEGSKHLSDYKGSKQLRCQILNGRDGRPTIMVDTYKKEGANNEAF